VLRHLVRYAERGLLERGLTNSQPGFKTTYDENANGRHCGCDAIRLAANAVQNSCNAMRALPLSKVYQLLEPGPVVLLTTARNGRANVMAMSWHMMIEFEPPQVACVVSGNDYSFAALRSTGECVIAVPARKLVRKVVDVGNSSGRDIDKFEAFGLTKLPASRVEPPLIADCFANLECKVTDMHLVNKYNLFILEVLKAWIDPEQKNPRTIHHRGYGTFTVDGAIIKLKSRMR
jgi:flavin reductase (DIM6/NTAB) family NADH-FMN oxidoreductase RutF